MDAAPVLGAAFFVSTSERGRSGSLRRPYSVVAQGVWVGFLEDWDLSYNEINELLTANPSLRSFVMGYAAEIKCRNMYFNDKPDITDIYKPDDHDRVEKGDWVMTYKGERLAVEVKSIQTNSLKPKKSGKISPTYQCDASDRRLVTFSDGSTLDTTALLVGEFDVLALNIHSFTGEWNFVFAKNADLPTMEGATRGAAKKYTPLQQRQLIKTLIPIDFEPDPSIYSYNPFMIMDSVLEDRKHGVDPSLEKVKIEDD